jgi:hypothetical protein
MSPSVDAPKFQSNHTVVQQSVPLDHPDHPSNKLWRGDKQGNVRMNRTPQFDDPYAEREWIKVCFVVFAYKPGFSFWIEMHLQEHMAASFRFWGKLGYGDDAAGHITVRDPVLTDHFWSVPDFNSGYVMLT